MSYSTILLERPQTSVKVWSSFLCSSDRVQVGKQYVLWKERKTDYQKLKSQSVLLAPWYSWKGMFLLSQIYCAGNVRNIFCKPWFHKDIRSTGIWVWRVGCALTYMGTLRFFGFPLLEKQRCVVIPSVLSLLLPTMELRRYFCILCLSSLLSSENKGEKSRFNMTGTVACSQVIDPELVVEKQHS